MKFAVHQTPDDPNTEVLGYVVAVPWLYGPGWDAVAVVPDRAPELEVKVGNYTDPNEATQKVHEYRQAGVYPLDCLKCGKPEHKHSCPTSTNLADHFHAAEYFDTCAGDVGVQHRLFPEAFPTPGPYVFTECGLLDSENEACWHVNDPDGETVNSGEHLESEAEAREWAAQYEPDLI